MEKKLAIAGLCLLLLSSASYAEIDPFSEDSEIEVSKEESVKKDSEEVETAKVITETQEEKKEEKKEEEKKEETSTTQYTVVPGDCLSAIAAKLLGSGSRWPEIVALNKDKYPSLASNPNLIYPGWVLTIPGGNSGTTGSNGNYNNSNNKGNNNGNNNGGNNGGTVTPNVNPSADDNERVASGVAPKRAVDSGSGAPGLVSQGNPSGSGVNSKSAGFQEWMNSAIDTYGNWDMPVVKNKYGQTISVEMYMKGILFIESNGTHVRNNGSLVTSYCGAQGFMQLMPATAAELGVDATDPKQNLEGGCKLFQKIFSGNYGYAGKATGVDKLMLVACSYNAGPWSKLVKGSWQDLKNTGSSVQGYGIKLKMCLGLELTADEVTYARNNLTNGQDVDTYAATLYATSQGYGL